MKLMVFVLCNVDLLCYLLEDLSNAGIKGATTIKSSGMGIILSKMQTSLAGNSLRGLFDSDRDDNRTIFCIINDNQLSVVKKVIHDVVGDLSKPDTGVFFTIPIDDIEGILT